MYLNVVLYEQTQINILENNLTSVDLFIIKLFTIEMTYIQLGLYKPFSQVT